MKGDSKVLKALNELLADERQAQIQYTIHSEVAEHFGYNTLHDGVEERRRDEHEHEEMLVERILFLGGKPEVEVSKVSAGEDIQQGIAFDLKAEQGAVEKYNKAIRIADEVGDYGTRKMLEAILVDEEAHLLYIEKQVTQIAQMGIDNFLSLQAGGEETADDDERG